MTVRLWLVRHGSTDTTDARRFLGWKDEPLNANGLQARDLRAKIKGMDFDFRWTSDLQRAVETAAVMAEGFRQDRRLREIDLGALEGMTWEECEPDQQATLLEFESFVASGGESVDQLRARVDEFLGELTAGDHLIVTHGGVIRLLLRQLQDDRPVATGEIVVLDWTNRRLSERTMPEPNLLMCEQRQHSRKAED